MIAVLKDAINCVENYRARKGARWRRDFDEVTQWLLAEETRWPFSFQCICEVLGLDASAVRHQLIGASVTTRGVTRDAHRQT